jgi:hypothetical protein
MIIKIMMMTDTFIQLLPYPRSWAKHLICIISINPIKPVQCYLTEEETQTQGLLLVQSQEICSGLEPDFNIGLSVVVLKVY